MKATELKGVKRRKRVIPAGENVFTDLGFDEVEAADLRVKAELTRQIHNRIKALALTQTQAAKRMSVSQPDVSKLMNGQFTGYSIDRLIALLNTLEMDVDIVVRPRKPTRQPARGVIRILHKADAA